jgi:rod shape-determining protein MreD
MKILNFLLFFIAVYIVQTVVLSRFAIFGVRPDLFLIITTLIAVTYGAEEGLILGFFFGIFQDLSSGLIPINMFTKALLGYLVGTFKESVIVSDEMVAFTAVSVATITSFILELVILFFFFGKAVSSPLVLFVTLTISCLYNGILAHLFYPVVKFGSKLVVE